MTPKAKSTALVLRGAVALSFGAYAIGSQAGGGVRARGHVQGGSQTAGSRPLARLPPRRLRPTPRRPGGRRSTTLAKQARRLEAALPRSKTLRNDKPASTATAQRRRQGARGRARRLQAKLSPHWTSASATARASGSAPRRRRDERAASRTRSPRSWASSAAKVRAAFDKLRAQGPPGPGDRAPPGRPREGDRRLGRPSCGRRSTHCARTPQGRRPHERRDEHAAELAKALGHQPQAKLRRRADEGPRAEFKAQQRPVPATRRGQAGQELGVAKAKVGGRARTSLGQRWEAWPSPDPLVLVVDDEASVRQALERALRLEGFAVVTAAGGQEALEAVAQRPPAVIVLDVTMPDLDGVSASSGGCAPAASTCRCASSPRATRSTTASPGCRRAPTTTSSSRSRSPS